MAYSAYPSTTSFLNILQSCSFDISNVTASFISSFAESDICFLASSVSRNLNTLSAVVSSIPFFLIYSKYLASSLFTSLSTLSCDIFTCIESVISCLISLLNWADTSSEDIYSLKPYNTSDIDALTSSVRLSDISFFTVSASILPISKSIPFSPKSEDISPKLSGFNTDESIESNIDGSNAADISSGLINAAKSGILISYILSSTLNALLIASVSI